MGSVALTSTASVAYVLVGPITRDPARSDDGGAALVRARHRRQARCCDRRITGAVTDGAGRVFITDPSGTIYWTDGSSFAPTPYLDITK